jgi:hypothetical protein
VLPVYGHKGKYKFDKFMTYVTSVSEQNIEKGRFDNTHSSIRVSVIFAYLSLAIEHANHIKIIYLSKKSVEKLRNVKHDFDSCHENCPYY